jgi:hypothetical protein
MAPRSNSGSSALYPFYVVILGGCNIRTSSKSRNESVIDEWNGSHLNLNFDDCFTLSLIALLFAALVCLVVWECYGVTVMEVGMAAWAFLNSQLPNGTSFNRTFKL